jgi:hypothetical protein
VVSWTHAQNLLPNPGFKEGTDQPAGWRLDGGAGTWAASAHAGRRAVTVEGKGQGSAAWRTDRLRLQPGGLYRLNFRGRREAGASGGCAVSGTSRVNRDWRFSDDWRPYGFVFTVPEDGTNDYLRLGCWETRGRLSFDDPELVPALAVHSPAEGLGEAESIRDGVYRFRPDYGWTGANYHRPLWRNRASFNSDRWVFSPGAEVIYRFVLPRGVAQTAARLRVNLNHHTAGTLRIEAGRDGQSWTRVAEFDGQNRGGQPGLPASLFPTKEVFVRLSVPGREGNLQVNTCDYEADLDGPRFTAEGVTRFFEVLTRHPDLAVTLVPGSAEGPLVDLQVSGSLSNASPRTFEAAWTLRSEGLTGDTSKVSLPPGQAAGFTATLRAPQPGSYPLTLKIEDARGQPLFAARTEARLGTLRDPRPGYWLSGDARRQLWWCESGWKISPRPVPADSPLRAAPKPVSVSAARGEYEAAQVCLCGYAGQTLQAASVGELRSRQGTVARVTVDLAEVVAVHVTRPTDPSCERGWYPDPLPPLVLPRPDLPPCLLLWLTFHVPRETPPGDYHGELTLLVDQETIRAPVSARVYGFELPRETHLRSAFGLGSGEINRYHKLKTPEDRQAVYEQYLKNFAGHRISPYSFFDYSGLGIRFTGEGTNKRAQVDFTRFDQAAAKWLDDASFNSFRLPLRGMGGGTFHSRHLGELEGFKEGTPEHTRLFQDYLGQVAHHLRERGWLDKAYTYWFDEPDPKDYEFVVEGMKRIRAAAPSLKRMLTEQPEKELLGHVEIWCGLTPEWTREKVAGRRAAGEEVWWYLCTGPKAPYVTIFIDHPGTEMRLWAWQSWQYGVQGILVWASTYWTSGAAFPDRLQDPWADPMGYVSGYDFKPGHVGYWGNGDGRFLYPPRRDPNAATVPSLDGPVTSFRWENLRDGLEDYEYFWLLDQEVKRVATLNRQSDLVAEAKRLLVVPETVSKDLTHFTTDPRLLLEHRDQVARMVERLKGL